MKGNTWLAGFIVFALLLVGGAGFYFAKGLGKFKAEYNGWDDFKSKIARLEKEPLYPNSENEEKLKDQLSEYEGRIDSLYQGLAKFQKPLENIQDREFPQKLKTKVEDFFKLADENGLVIGERENFYFGFDAYSSSLPEPELVPLLNYQLEATDHLLKQLVESGASELVRLSREMLPGEDPNVEITDAEGSKSVAQKYPITLEFVGKHGDFQNFVNRIANDDKYFFILRALKAENSAPNGPEIGEEDTGMQFVNVDGESASENFLLEMGRDELSEEEFIEKMREEGYELVDQDARILFGQENVGVAAVIDLVRFLPPEKVESEK